MIKVVADNRERNHETLTMLRALHDVELSIQKLEVGDYLVDGRFISERKTLSDFISSIKDGRLFRQAMNLLNSPWQGVIILEGQSIDFSKTGMRREAIQGVIINLSLVLGIPILRAKDPAESARLMVYTARQVHSTPHKAKVRPGKLPKGKHKLQLHILQGFPGIGPAKAQELLTKFGSLEAIFLADPEELTKVEGIGKKLADKIRWVVSEPELVWEKYN